MAESLAVSVLLYSTYVLITVLMDFLDLKSEQKQDAPNDDIVDFDDFNILAMRDAALTHLCMAFLSMAIIFG